MQLIYSISLRLLLRAGLCLQIACATRVGLGAATECLQPQLLNPSTPGGLLSSIAFDGSTWITVGAKSTILRSTDGLHWQPQEANANVCFRQITYANGTWLSLTYCSTVVTSHDSLHWEPRESPACAFGVSPSARVSLSESESPPPSWFHLTSQTGL
jgi:hypothetical protein